MQPTPHQPLPARRASYENSENEGMHCRKKKYLHFKFDVCYSCKYPQCTKSCLLCLWGHRWNWGWNCCWWSIDHQRKRLTKFLGISLFALKEGWSVIFRSIRKTCLICIGAYAIGWVVYNILRMINLVHKSSWEIKSFALDRILNFLKGQLCYALIPISRPDLFWPLRLRANYTLNFLLFFCWHGRSSSTWTNKSMHMLIY